MWCNQFADMNQCLIALHWMELINELLIQQRLLSLIVHQCHQFRHHHRLLLHHHRVMANHWYASFFRFFYSSFYVARLRWMFFGMWFIISTNDTSNVSRFISLKLHLPLVHFFFHLGVRGPFSHSIYQILF